jgi:hypothetical protein
MYPMLIFLSFIFIWDHTLQTCIRMTIVDRCRQWEKYSLSCSGTPSPSQRQRRVDAQFRQWRPNQQLSIFYQVKIYECLFFISLPILLTCLFMICVFTDHVGKIVNVY